MQRKQLWTKISGGLMSLFVLVNIISCGNIHHDDTGTVTSGWVSKESGTTEDLRGIACKGTTWVAVGENGIVIVSTDNGNTWATKPSGTENDLYGVACNGTAWIAAGKHGTVIVSTDTALRQ